MDQNHIIDIERPNSDFDIFVMITILDEFYGWNLYYWLELIYEELKTN